MREKFILDVSEIGGGAPASTLSAASLGYFRTEDENDPAAAAVDLLLEQFKRPIRDGGA